jgi:hypothetical protein
VAGIYSEQLGRAHRFVAIEVAGGKERSMKRLVGLLVSGLVVTMLAGSSLAQDVALFCTNPNLHFSFLVDIDYARSTVTFRMDDARATARTFRAQVSDATITWEMAGITREYANLNRYSGTLQVCDGDGCTYRQCRPTRRQF